MKICRYFDSAVLKPNLTREETVAAIQTAIDENSYTVCVRGCDIPLAVEMTKGTRPASAACSTSPMATAARKSRS